MFAYHFVKLVAVGILAATQLTTTAFFCFTEIAVNLLSLCVCPLAELGTHKAATVPTVQQTGEPVSYTHLDVYKRQIYTKKKKKMCPGEMEYVPIKADIIHSLPVDSTMVVSVKEDA